MQLLHGEPRGEGAGPAEGTVPQQLHGLPGPDQRHPEPAGPERPAVAAPGLSPGNGFLVSRWRRRGIEHECCSLSCACRGWGF